MNLKKIVFLELDSEDLLNLISEKYNIDIANITINHTKATKIDKEYTIVYVNGTEKK